MKPKPPAAKPPTRARSTLGWWYTATGKARQQKMLGTIVGIAAALLFPLINNLLGLGWEAKSVPITLFIVLALGLNVVVGFAGLLDLGYAAFFAIGAYTMAILVVKEGWSTWLAAPLGVLAAAAAGLLLGLPALRLRADYFAIVTIAFSEIVRYVATNEDRLTGGSQGTINLAGAREAASYNAECALSSCHSKPAAVTARLSTVCP